MIISGVGFQAARFEAPCFLVFVRGGEMEDNYWQDVKGYEGFYQINKKGQVKSLARYVPVYRSDGTVLERKIRERILKPKLSNNDLYFGLSREGCTEEKAVYEWMRLQYNPDQYFKEYKDGDPNNTHLSNLVFSHSHRKLFNIETDKLKESYLTQELIHELFEYREDGNLIWKKRESGHFNSYKAYRAFNSEYAGKVAWYYNKRCDSSREDFGYWRVSISLCGATGYFKLHRLIFLYHHGYLPKVVDHKDRDQSNNRIDNLRESTSKRNSYNSRICVANTTGYKGVSCSSDLKRRNKPFRAAIEYDGYNFTLGNYSDPEEAATAYNIAAKLFFKEDCSLNENLGFKEEDFKWKGKFFSKQYFEILNGTFNWESKSKRKGKAK